LKEIHKKKITHEENYSNQDYIKSFNNEDDNEEDDEVPEKVVQTKSGRDVKSKNRKAEEVSHARGSKGGKNEAQVSLDKRKAR